MMMSCNRRRWEYRRAGFFAAFWCAALFTAAVPVAASTSGGAPTPVGTGGEFAPDEAVSPSCGRIELAQASSLCCRNGVLHQRTTVGGKTTIIRIGGACPPGTPPC